MGNPSFPGTDPRVRLFASSSSWVEGNAISQLNKLMLRSGMVAVAGMPDLHPGVNAPVGCAALARGCVFPDLVGTDIGCGMQLWALDLPARRLKLDKAADRMMALEGSWSGDAQAALDESGIIHASDHVEALGTVGGGNHFCEVQAVEEIIDPVAASRVGLQAGGLSLLVHSGSRSFGAAVAARYQSGAGTALVLDGAGQSYLDDHDVALRYASLNRAIIAQRALDALRCDGEQQIDNPHNLAERQGDLVLHRKGAAPSDRGLVPIPGSRGTFTYLVEPLAQPVEALSSLAHGAGRKYDRASMPGRLRSSGRNINGLVRNPYGGHVICLDRQLLMEEAPDAYKDIGRIIADLETGHLARVVAILRPVITFKTARKTVRPQGRINHRRAQ